MDLNDNGEEITIADVLKDLRKVWPFSVIFPETIKPEKEMAPKNEGGDHAEPKPDKPPPIIGQNIDPGIDQGLGLLHFLLRYDVQGEKLKINILQGKNLVGKDPRGTSDPYAEVRFDPRFRDDWTYKTEIKMKTLNPIWNHVFVFYKFTHEDLDRYRIHIRLFDWDKYGEHEALGEVFYDLKKLHGKDHDEHIEIPTTQIDKDNTSSNYEKHSIKDWVERSNSKYDIEEQEVQLDPITEEDHKIVARSASMIFNDNFDIEEEFEEEEGEVEEPEDNIDGEQHNFDVDNEKLNTNIIRKIEIKKNLQALPNSRSPYGEILISLDYAIRTRTLNVKIIKAKNMIDPTRRALVPYCVLRHLFISNDREKTKSIHRTSYRFYTDSPVWNEEFQLKVAPNKLKQTAVEIQVFHSTKESKPKDDELGLIRLGLKTYPAQKAHYVEFLENIGKPIANWHLIRI